MEGVSRLRTLQVVLATAAVLRAFADSGEPWNPLRLPPAEEEGGKAMKAAGAASPSGLPVPEPLLKLRERGGRDAPTTLGSLRPDDLEGTPASLDVSNESVEVYHFSVLADRFMASGDATSALRLLANAEAIAPGNPAVLERLARANEVAGDLSRALTWWSMLELMFPDDGEVRVARIRALLLAGRAADARTAAEEAGRVPGVRRHLLSRFYLDMLRLLDPSVAPPSPAGYTVQDLSVLVRRIQGPQREVDELLGAEFRPVVLRWLLTGEKVAVEAVPAGWVGQAGRAGEALATLQISLRDGRPEDAAAALRTLDEIGMKSPWLELARAEWCIAARRPGEAVPLLTSLRDAATRSQALSLRGGELWLAAGDPARAVELLRDAALMDRSHPDAPRAEFLLMCALTAQGQDAAALPLLRRLAHERPAKLREWMRGDSAGAKAVRASTVLAPVLSETRE